MSGPATIELPSAPSERWVDEYLSFPERIRVSDWVEENVVMPPTVSPVPGPVDLSLSPHIREVLDATGEIDVHKITMKKCTQSSGTTVMQWSLMHTIAVDPGPCIMVMPTEATARKTSDIRMLPLLRHNRVTRRHLPSGGYDITKLQYKLKHMHLLFGWASSPASLAAFPARKLFLDEVNKFPKFSGKEADPTKLGGERLEWFWNWFIMQGSTPTMPGAYIDREYQLSDQRQYQVPCPHCKGRQPWRFKGHVKYPEGATPDEIERKELAWYICARCEERIEEHHRIQMNLEGVWAPAGCTVNKGGQVVGEKTSSPHRGYWWNRFVTPRGTFSRIAAEHERSKGDPATLMNWVNSWMSEEWEEYAKGPNEIVLLSEESDDDPEILTVPKDTVLVTAGADVQLDHIWYVVRAWCEDEITWLVNEGKVFADLPDDAGETVGAGVVGDFDELAATVLTPTFVGEDGMDWSVRGLGIDARYRQEEVYDFARQHVERVYPILGSSTQMMRPFKVQNVDAMPTRKKRRKKITGLFVYTFDTAFYKGRIARLSSQGRWKLPQGVSGAYYRHIASEKKVIHRDSLGNPTEKWELKKGYADNHLLDCEMINCGVADVLGYWRVNREKLRGEEGKASGGGGSGEWFSKQRKRRR